MKYNRFYDIEVYNIMGKHQRPKKVKKYFPEESKSNISFEG